MYSSDPVLDAGRYYDALYNAADDYDRAIADGHARRVAFHDEG